jgi:acetyl-CoA carboxylase biotin carboxyl carrier protein
MSAAEVRSPTVGRILEVLVAVGDTVRAGDEVLVIESMKMEIPVTASRDGTVRELRVEVGAQVQADDLLAVVG